MYSGNDLVDEDVDIVGGNDAPISSFPPVEIEKDAAQRNSKCSSSSSSSSESGSSSSGSCFFILFIYVVFSSSYKRTCGGLKFLFCCSNFGVCEPDS